MRIVHANPSFVSHEGWDCHAWLLPTEQRGEPWYYSAPSAQIPREREVPSGLKLLTTVNPAIELTGPGAYTVRTKEPDGDMWERVRDVLQRAFG